MDHLPHAAKSSVGLTSARAGGSMVADRPPDVETASRSTDLLEARLHLSLVEEMDRSSSGGPAVTVLCWPGDQVEARQLAARGIPRLLVVAPATAPVHQRDELEDWVRLPVTDQDVCVRLRTLRSRAARRPPRPWLDGAGRLLFLDRWVVLSETEERLAGLLLDHFGQVVPTEQLLEGGWPSGAPGEDGFRPMISRLRRRCAKVGVEITTIRGRGYGIDLKA